MGKKKAGKEKRQATGFKETECCFSAVIQRATRCKNNWMKVVPGVAETFDRPIAILTHPKRGWGLHYHVEAAVDWCRTVLFAQVV